MFLQGVWEVFSLEQLKTSGVHFFLAKNDFLAAQHNFCFSGNSEEELR
jgi:hypothetical protein